MAINVDLLIAAPMLQDLFRDKTGIPLAGGVVTCYQDNSRTTLKNWFYQTGTPGQYTYIPLPNPMTLSAAGTIVDNNGVDTIPFFYPYSESDSQVSQPYYITVYNAQGTLQFTRSNFPFIAPSGNNPGTNVSFENYIINNRFWRNRGTINVTNLTFATICPSQHDGFSFPDITFQKNITGNLDTITFTKFPLGNAPVLKGDITPEYYINHNCSSSSSGETQKGYFFPISLHVNTLSGVPFTFTIQGQNVGSTGIGQNVITIFIYQFAGTGATSPAPQRIGAITLNSSWQKYEISNTFPTTSGLSLGGGGDDALYLIVQMPLSTQCSINFTLPSIYLSSTVPVNNFQTYDQIDSIINSPRTGDLRTTLNSFHYFGWVPMNDGFIGNAFSNSNTRASTDTWPLFNLLWNIGITFDAGSGSPFNPISQMRNSSSVPINYGVSAIADFNANNQLALTKMMGKVLLGTVPASTILSSSLANFLQAFTATDSGGFILFTCTQSSFLFQGQAVNFTLNPPALLPENIVTNAIYYVTKINVGGANTFMVSTTYANAILGTAIGYSSNGSGFVYLDPTGATLGEYAHTQTISELVSHNHTASVPAFPTTGSTASLPQGSNTGTPQSVAVTVQNTGGGNPFNVTQPGTFYNIFIKL